jgi:DedD protein
VIRASSYAALIAKMRGDTDDAPRDRKWVVTVETTPVAPTPLVPHLASSAVVAPPPLAIAAPPAPVAPPPVTVAAPPVTITPPPVAVAAPPVAALPVPTRTHTSSEQSAPLAVAVSVEEPPIAIAPSPPLAPAERKPLARASVMAITSYWVQVGAFKTAEAAARVAAELRRAGLAAWNGALTTLPGNAEPTLVRVRVGPFASRADAQAKLHELITRGYTPFIATDVQH